MVIKKNVAPLAQLIKSEITSMRPTRFELLYYAFWSLLYVFTMRTNTRREPRLYDDVKETNENKKKNLIVLSDTLSLNS